MNTQLPHRDQLTAEQLRVQEFAADQHAVITGAPGSGKTTLAVHAALQHAHTQQTRTPLSPQQSPLQHYDGALLLGCNRRTAERLQQLYLQGAPATVKGKVALTVTAFALLLLQQRALATGGEKPRLLTAVRQNELLESALAESDFYAATGLQHSDLLLTQLRDLWRVVEDTGVTPEGIAELSGVAPEKFYTLWHAAVPVLRNAMRIAAVNTEFTPSGITAAARKLLLDLEVTPAPELPQRLLVDDAADLTLGEQKFLTACAQRGCAVWVFGNPDLATAAYAGGVPEGLALARQATPLYSPSENTVQTAALQTVHRSGAPLVALAQQLTAGIGTAAGAQHRVQAIAASPHAPCSITARKFTSRAEVISAVATELRRNYLGVADTPKLRWRDMAVICRSRDEVLTLARELRFREVPTRVSGGGVVFREHQITLHLLLLLQTVSFGGELSAQQAIDILSGPLFGLNAVQLQRLRAQLRVLALRTPAAAADTAESAAADTAAPEMGDAAAVSSDELLLRALAGELRFGNVTTPEVTAVKKLSRVLQAGHTTLDTEHTVLQTLWQIWDTCNIADELQEQALGTDRLLAEHANSLLDPVMELFFVLHRNEESPNSVKVEDLLTELLESSTPQDTLAAAAAADTVLITTPQGAVGTEYQLVCVTQLQQGTWPNLKRRGNLIGLAEFESLLETGTVLPDSTTSTLHDELRLLLVATSRAKTQLHAFGIVNETETVSAFWHFFKPYETAAELLPGVTLRSHVARLRAQLEANPEQPEIAQQLAALAAAGVPGTDPDSWYGVRDLSTAQGYATGDTVRVAPSALSTIEDCPLQGVLNKLSSDSPGTHHLAVGTLLHSGLEQFGDSPEGAAAHTVALAETNWGNISFETPAQAELELQVFTEMAAGVERYLRDTTTAGWTVLGSEVPFEFEFGDALVSGKIDRIETRHGETGAEYRIIDLKSSKTLPSKDDAAKHAQLAVYTYALTHGHTPFTVPADAKVSAELLFPHPKAADKRGYNTRELKLADTQVTAVVTEHVAAAVAALREQPVPAETEAHCENSNGGGAALSECQIQLLPPVSWQE